MLLGNKRTSGKCFTDLKVGETCSVKKDVTDQDILLYLGLTSDANPIFIQRNFAEQTPYKRPIVPSLLITGYVTQLISSELPGPGSIVQAFRLAFPSVVYHYSTITLKAEIISLNSEMETVTFHVAGHDMDDRLIVEGEIDVKPPFPLQPILNDAFDNF